MEVLDKKFKNFKVDLKKKYFKIEDSNKVNINRRPKYISRESCIRMVDYWHSSSGRECLSGEFVRVGPNPKDRSCCWLSLCAASSEEEERRSEHEGLGSVHYSDSFVYFPESGRTTAAAREASAGGFLEHEDECCVHYGSCCHIWIASHAVPCHIEGSSLHLV
ncbi:hypothetical protein Cni_G20194 [Canna indica]|uniref:Uncharacterized protein n=1 Tax=Canna indica TaxID=4628 RepID=A0AAQ3KSZ4_9LILI|nr:hypothetical protein Cni_G20194 [Canna indica]